MLWFDDEDVSDSDGAGADALVNGAGFSEVEAGLDVVVDGAAAVAAGGAGGAGAVGSTGCGGRTGGRCAGKGGKFAGYKEKLK